MRSYFFSHLSLPRLFLSFFIFFLQLVQMVLVVDHKISWFHNVETAILIFEVLMDYFVIKTTDLLRIFIMFKDIYFLYGNLAWKICLHYCFFFALLYEKFRTRASTMENILIHVHAQDYEQDLDCYWYDQLKHGSCKLYLNILRFSKGCL